MTEQILSAAFPPDTTSIGESGWPDASLPEHKSLGKFPHSVSLVAWGYNEELLVEGFLQRAVALLDATILDWEIVFVDDCSTDRMPEILARFAATEPRLKIIRHARNLNVGLACRTALANARKEFVFWQTVDWSYDISCLRIFLELTNYFDVVQGIRPVPIRLLSYIPIIRSLYRVRRRSDNIYKAIISLANYYILRILFGVQFQDFQNVTFYPTHLVHNLQINARTSFINPELLLKSYYGGARFIEVPIRFIARTKGIAKGTKPAAVIRSVIDTARNWIAWGVKSRWFSEPQSRQPIRKVSEPFRLDQNILRLVLPLFDDFKS